MVDIGECREIADEIAEIIAPMTSEEKQRVKDALALVKYFKFGKPIESTNESSRSA